MKKIRLKDKHRTKIVIFMIVCSVIWLYSSILSNINVVDKLNECLQKHDRNYCENHIK